MTTPALSPFEQALIYNLGRLVDAIDRNTLAVSNGPKPMLTDDEAAARCGFAGLRVSEFMERLRTTELVHSIKGGHHRLWSAEQIDSAFKKCHESKTDFVPSVAHIAQIRKQRAR